MTNTEILSVISSCITFPLSLSYILILLGEWSLWIKNKAKLIIGYLLIAMAITVLAFAVFGVSAEIKTIIMMMHLIFNFIFTLVISKNKGIQLLFCFSSALIFVFIGDTMTGIISPEAGIVHVITKLFVYLVIGFCLYYFLRPLFLEGMAEIAKSWKPLLLMIMSLCSILFFTVIVEGPLYKYKEVQLLVISLCVASACIYISFYYFLHVLKEQFRVKAEYRILKTHIISIEKHVHTMQQMREQIYILRHDMRHYIQMQTVCFNNGDLEGAEKTLEAFRDKLEETGSNSQMKEYTGELMIDAVLSFYADQTDEAGIIMKIRMEAPDHSVETAEFAVVLSNALENALNACLKMPKEEIREIRVVSGMNKGQYCLEILNTFAGTVNFDHLGLPVTEELGHGFGTQSILYFVKKRNAFLDFHTENGWFRIRLIL